MSALHIISAIIALALLVYLLLALLKPEKLE
jgi:K+-transporting ATPase KdpF subunit